MAISPGTRIGPYEITVLLGQGGMGEVYRARDTRLKRDAALKLLPPDFASDQERLARFQREAELLASLNHPNIAQIYGLEGAADAPDGAYPVLVMELVQGPTLADLIASRAGASPPGLPLANALAIATQIAAALEAAHEGGIVHRDLKPANIKVRPDGTVKVLDFGLAKSIEGRRTSDFSQSPTMMSPVVVTGGATILGTAAYMSPEQARGRVVDKRTDVWAFGCVLFEMLSGERPFPGDDVMDVLAAIVRAEPRWEKLPQETPASIRRLLARCLQKDVTLRLRDIGDARFELTEPTPEAATVAAPPLISRTRLYLAVGAAALALAAVTAALSLRPSAGEPRELRLEISTPTTTEPASFSVSPDGQQIVFVADVNGLATLWVRRLDDTAARPLPGTEGATLPFWSPDSRSVGFFANRALKRVSLDGGPPQTLTPAPVGTGGTWNADDVMVVALSGVGFLSRIDAAGGNAVPITQLAEGQTGHRAPHFLPDGQHFLFYAQGRADQRGIYLGTLDGTPPVRLLDADAGAIPTGASSILVLREGTLLSQQLDRSTYRPTGEPSVLATAVAMDQRRSAAAVSATATGIVVYRTGGVSVTHQLTWFDRTGKALGPPLLSDTSDIWNPELSPDGRTLAMDRTVDGNTDIWTLDMVRGVLTRITSAPALDRFPIWQPDGRGLILASTENGGAFRLYQRSLDADARQRPLGENIPGPDAQSAPMDVTADGDTIVFRNRGLRLRSLTKGTDGPVVASGSNFGHNSAQFSPNERSIAYESGESGRVEVYLQSLAPSGAKVQISSNGGTQPRWRGDGRELFYIGLDGRLMSVGLAGDGDVPTDIGAPQPLFTTRIAGGPLTNNLRAQYLVSTDGQRFLINNLGNEPQAPLTVMVNPRPVRADRAP